jgi:putative endonuclease
MKTPGTFSENVALRWLKKKGLRVVANNYRSSAGKADIIMLDGRTLCFIEVKYQGEQEIDALAHILSADEQQKMIQAASSFVSHQRKYHNYPRRFDALIIRPAMDEPYEINWIKQVFSTEDAH